MNKQEWAYRIIRERILDGTYRPGHRLVIDQLARELGVSPLPVREAIRRLEAEGWVVFRPNAGARVAPLDPDQWEAVMAVLAVLEGTATVLAAPGIDAEDRARLRAVNARMERAVDEGDLVAAGRLNRVFHFAIYERCPNAYLLDMLRQTWDRLDTLRRAIFLYIPERVRESVAEHEQLIRLLEAGRPAEEIERAAREHKLRTVEAYRRTLSWHAAAPVQHGARG